MGLHVRSIEVMDQRGLLDRFSHWAGGSTTAGSSPVWTNRGRREWTR
ncbi:hypothetical protein [Kibdelosporangium phytohabitans]|nr:hypothetical protein [Kibdelosporangium phytohabitans]